MKATINSTGTPWLRVRTGPSLAASVVGTIRNGTVVELQAVDGAWATVAACWGDVPLFDERNQPARWYLSANYLTLEQPPPPDGIAQVPWFSQVGNEYVNDCGPAAWLMLAAYCGINTSVGALVRLMGVAPQLTGADTAVACRRKLGLQADKGSHIVEPPFMCLVYYPKLPKRYITYDGYHWIVVVGTVKDASGAITDVIVNDPLWPSIEQGAYLRIGGEQFHTAEHGTQNRARCWK